MDDYKAASPTEEQLVIASIYFYRISLLALREKGVYPTDMILINCILGSRVELIDMYNPFKAYAAHLRSTADKIELIPLPRSKVYLSASPALVLAA